MNYTDTCVIPNKNLFSFCLRSPNIDINVAASLKQLVSIHAGSELLILTSASTVIKKFRKRSVNKKNMAAKTLSQEWSSILIAYFREQLKNKAKFNIDLNKEAVFQPIQSKTPSLETFTVQKQMELGLKKLNDACQTYNLKNQLVLEEKAHLKQQMMARSREPSSTRAFSVGNKSVNSLSSCVGTKTPSVHGPRKSEIESTNPLRRTLFPVIIKKPNRSSNMLSDGGPLHTSTPLDAAEDTIRLNQKQMELGLKKFNDACQTYNLKNQLVLEEKARLKQQMMALQHQPRSREPSSTRAFSVGNKSVNSLSSCVGTKTPSVHGPRKSEIESTNPLRRTLFPVISKKPNRSSNMFSDGGPLHTSTPLDAAEDTIRLNQKQMELGLKKLNDACQTYNLKNQLVLEEKAHLKQQMMARSREPSSTRAFSVGNKSVNSLSSCVGTKTPSVHGPRKSEIESTNPLRRTLFPVIIKKPNRSSNMLSDGGPLHTSTPLDAAEDTIRLNTFKMPKEIRVKVKKRWARNIFYPKLLRDWMEAAGTSEAKRTFKNALEGTSKYPFHIIDQSELKQVPGVGPTLSVKLDDAYRELCNFMSPEPDIHLIDKLGRGEALALLTSAKKANKVSRKKSLGKPNDKRKSGLSQEIVNMRVEECDTSQVREGPNESMSQELPELERSIYVADPSTEKGEVVLVCDNREQTGMRGKKSVVDYLIKNNVPHQLRPLSVGDFIWLWKTETREIVLDYVIERKAWDDLKSSIRSNRLDDQKTRLKDSGVANLVLLAEGRETPDESLEQCLATFSVTHKFFIQRTENASDTALFLRTLTERFEARAKNESFSGPNYTHYQDKNKKTKPLTVREIFAKQLTVCPQMSIDKALLIAQRFPNFKSLFKLYQLNNTKGEGQRTCPKVLLNKHISQIPVSLSTQVSVFFNKT
uniref:Crossover junction endonuclease MUS81 n=1 Tax=Rhabditophanes sp. KR3021 TaxID=114890 RepID=A0AC35TYE0_9BILA